MLVTEPTVKEKNGEKKIIAVVTAVALHVALGILFLFITVVPALRDEPELVAKVIAANEQEDNRMEKRTVMKQVKQVSATAASPLAKMMRSNSAAKLVAPKVSKVAAGPIGLGQGEFGAGFGTGSAGLGSGVSFFGSRSNGRRFLFVLDHSASMSTTQEALRNRELKKALEKLPSGIQYQVILFGGGAMFAEPGWEGKDVSNGEFEVKDPRNKKYVFKPYRGITEWEFEGSDEELPRSKWLAVSQTNIKRTLSSLVDVKKFFGTDWGIALKIGHLMKPAPDVIFFMSDGSGGNAPRPILEINRQHGRPVINTFAMQTTAGAKQFHEIATKTGGEFVIVKRDGKPTKVTDPNDIQL